MALSLSFPFSICLCICFSCSVERRPDARGFYRFAPRHRRRTKPQTLVTPSENCYLSLSNRYARRREPMLGPCLFLVPRKRSRLPRQSPVGEFSPSGEIGARDSRSRATGISAREPRTLVEKMAQGHLRRDERPGRTGRDRNDYLYRYRQVLFGFDKV